METGEAVAVGEIRQSATAVDDPGASLDSRLDCEPGSEESFEIRSWK